MSALRPLVMEAYDNRLPAISPRFSHTHGGNELQLVWDTGLTVTRDGVPIAAPPGTLVLHRHDEAHGLIREGALARLLVINYEPDEAAEAELPALGRDARRVWRLDDRQKAAFLDLFTRLQLELDRDRPGRAQAASAWLRLILVLVARLDRDGTAPAAAAGEAVDAEVHRLRRAIDLRRQGSVSGPLAGLVENYDALRHRFRRAYGETPARMLGRLRVEKAKSLLVSSDLAMSAIAQQVGYARQHEFARAFRREVGCTPSAFRRQSRGG